MNRAYSVLETKAVDEDKRIVEGIATTPTPDRMGDIVEPMGAQFDLPLPALLFHDSKNPVAKVVSAKPTKQGIPFRMQFPQAGVLAKVDEAWAMLKEGLIRGVSIGFREIESTGIKETGGYRFTKWEWLELSLVSIPANAEATITSIKSFDQVADQGTRAALGRNAAPVVLLKSSPGATGTKSTGAGMQTHRERLEALEAKRAATVAQMEALDTKAAEEGRTFDEAEQQQFDALDIEIKAIDGQVARAKRMADLAIANAKAVQPQDGQSPVTSQNARTGGSPILFQRSNVEKGIAMARVVKALAMSHGNVHHAFAIAEQNKTWQDTSPQVAQYLKAAVGAGTTTGSAWADDLVYAQNIEGEFVDMLRPRTIVGRIPGLRRVPFNIRVGTKTSGGTAYWVGQGAAIPLSKFATGDITLGRTKLAGMMSITEELARDSSPSAEMMVRDDLAAEIVQLMDESFINPDRAEVSGISPASVTNGVTPVTATGITAATLRTDIATLFGKFDTAMLPTTGGVWIMTPRTATNIALMTNALGQPEFPGFNPEGGTFLGFPVVVSLSALTTTSPRGGNLLIFMLPREVFLADDGGVDIRVSTEASLEMSDAPANNSGTGTGASLVSMYQTDSLAIRALRYVNWKKRRADAVQYINDAMYTA